MVINNRVLLYLVFGGEGHVELLLVPDLGLQAVADAARRVAQPRVRPRLDRLVAQLLRQRQHPVAEKQQHKSKQT